MLSVFGAAKSSAGRASRREFLQIGALGMGGLSLPGLLRAEQASGIGRSHKAVIMIYLVGAPPHQDMYDLKMDAPDGIRGEFKPIETKVPGIQISEHLPKLASIMDKLIPLRSVHGSPSGDHDSFICYTGRSVQKQPAGGWPSLGSTVSKVLGAANPSVPPFVGLAPNAGHAPYGSPGHPGFLGVAHAAFHEKVRYTLSILKGDNKIDAGEYKIRVEGADGLALNTPKFELKKGDKVTVRVTVDPKAVAKNDDPDRTAAEWVLSIGGIVKVNEQPQEIKAVANLPQEAFRLTSVELHDNKQLSDAGMAHFKDCKNLTTLGLQSTQVSDAGLAHLKDCKNLWALYLGGTRVSDAGLAYFKDCKSLKDGSSGNRAQ